MMLATRTTVLTLWPAADVELWAVAQLFAVLHQFNVGLDPRCRLAKGLEPLLREYFVRTHRAPGTLWLLAWRGAEPTVLLLKGQHRLAALRRAPPGRSGGALRHPW